MTFDLPLHIRPVVIELLREVLGRGESLTFIVHGNSMVLTLVDGDRVKVVPVSLDDLESGDLLAYVGAGNQVIIHRLVRVDGDYVILRGDNKTQDDPPVHMSRILGRAEKWTPAGSG